MEVPFFNTYINPKANEYVADVLKSTFLSEGSVVKNFEKQLAEQLGLINPVAVNSGTSALHLALIAAGVGQGDEVIIPAQTFIATGLAVLYVGATPVFADIQYKTGNIDPVSVKEKITERTKAIISVHWGGYPCDLDEINELAKEHNLIVVEDAAHALGAFYKDRPIGSISDYTCFSFQAIKHLTTGDGGAICTKNKFSQKQILQLRWFGIDRENALLTELGERDYNLQQVGFKYHLNNYAAALGLANLLNFNERLLHRGRIASIYRKGLQFNTEVKVFDNKSDRVSSNWFFGCHVENRLNFIRKLKEYNIPTSVVHLRIDRNALFDGSNNDLINQQMFNETQINLPIHENITEDFANHIVDIIKTGW